ncbi:MAG: sporulation protein YqfD [Desulfotomaculum sp.]|nr:sporulation protein YqfD [Desulfotomaculum sp.]
MFLFRLMSFLFGHVSLIVQGKTLEKFINMASSRGIYLWDITKVGKDKMLVRVRISGIKPLRHIARSTGSRFKINSREGMPFLIERMKKRKVMVVGAVVFLAVLYMLSSFIWFIDISGNNKLTREEVLRAARQAGLAPGVLKWNVNKTAVEQNIKDKLPIVSWAGVYIKGTKARIEIVEKKMPEKKAAENQPAHIVAKKAGLIKDVLVLSGQAAVKEGDTVSAGQVLISGEIIPGEKPESELQTGEEAPSPITMPRYVHAKGIVRARVWYEGYGEARLVEEGKRLSGRQVERVCMKIAGKEIILKGPKEVPFKEYERREKVKTLPVWRNIKVPVELYNVQFLELEDYREERSLKEARKQAEKKAVSAIKEKMPADAKIMEQRVERINTGQDENLVRVKVFIESLENIGEEKTFTP